MPEILVTKKVPIAEDGIHVVVYEPSEIPKSVNDRTAKLIMDCNAGKLFEEKVEEVVVETKSISSAPNNAMMDGPKEDKKEVKEEFVIEVCNLADELSVSSKKVISNAAVLGITGLKPNSKLTAEQVNKIKAKLGK